jgi:hypothetical protein
VNIGVYFSDFIKVNGLFTPAASMSEHCLGIFVEGKVMNTYRGRASGGVNAAIQAGRSS